MSRARGFTLLEILLAVGIGAVVMGMAVVSVRGRFESEARRATNTLTGAIHFLFNKAASEAKTYRLAFDLEKQTFWIEVAEGEFVLPSAEAEQQKGTTHEGQSAEKKAQKKEQPSGKEQTAAKEDGGEGSADAGTKEHRTYQSPTETTFGPAAGLPRSLAQPVAMPRKVVIKDLITTQRKEPITSGTAYLYFFPQGYAESAVINLSNVDGNRFVALVVNPFTGFTKVYYEHREHL